MKFERNRLPRLFKRGQREGTGHSGAHFLSFQRSAGVNDNTRSAHGPQNAFSFRSINSTECDDDIAQR